MSIASTNSETRVNAGGHEGSMHWPLQHEVQCVRQPVTRRAEKECPCIIFVNNFSKIASPILILHFEAVAFLGLLKTS